MKMRKIEMKIRRKIKRLMYTSRGKYNDHLDVSPSDTGNGKTSINTCT